jgi:hypothetical protein
VVPSENRQAPTGTTFEIRLTRELAPEIKLCFQQKKLFREQFGRDRSRMIRCFSSQASPFPNFSVMSPLKKYGRVD